MIAYARHMKCPSCQRRKPPERIPRAAVPYRPTRFNHTVGVDLKWIKDADGIKHIFLNILVLTTTFNIVARVPNKEPQTIANAFKQNWMNWAHIPEKIVADKGSEYYTDFQDMMNTLGIKYRMIPTEAPWRLGMVARHGSVISDIMNIVVNETVVK